MSKLKSNSEHGQAGNEKLSETKLETKKSELAGKRALKAAKNVYFALLGVFVALILVFLVFNLIAQNKAKNGEKVPLVWGFANVAIDGHSMSPTMDYGDLIVIHSEREYQVGDVITFKDNHGATVTHRIIGVREATAENERSYRTKGDYSGNAADQVEGDYENYLTADRIYGKVVLHFRGLADTIKFLQTPAGIMVMLVVGFVLVSLPTLVEKLAWAIKTKKAKKLNQSSQKTEQITIESEFGGKNNKTN